MDTFWLYLICTAIGMFSGDFINKTWGKNDGN